eukprot:GHRQ01028478.1.p1 GENE.GHRQ01028478.1~~GHRQ01028478.1.p1  ORF type:complete len:109 (+),score=21.32 GHRQ01028478.1:303-629(+)
MQAGSSSRRSRPPVFCDGTAGSCYSAHLCLYRCGENRLAVRQAGNLGPWLLVKGSPRAPIHVLGTSLSGSLAVAQVAAGIPAGPGATGGALLGMLAVPFALPHPPVLD